MPISISHPGIHVQEPEPGPGAIGPVATSVAAFVGRAPYGSTEEPGAVFNFGDFTRAYGGLHVDCPMSYAVKDFFDNGGSQAVIARLFEPTAGAGDGTARLEFPPAPATTAHDANHLILAAASPGQWGNYLSAAADTNGITDATANQFAEYGLLAEDLFSLTLTRKDAEGRVVAVEQHRNLSVKTGGDADRFPNRLDRYLEANSNLARVPGALPSTPPANDTTAIGLGGDDGAPLSPATYLGDPARKTGLHLLDKTQFNLLSIPPDQRFLPGSRRPISTPRCGRPRPNIAPADAPSTSSIPPSPGRKRRSRGKSRKSPPMILGSPASSREWRRRRMPRSISRASGAKTY